MFLAGTERSLAVYMEHGQKEIWRIAVSCDGDAVSSPAWVICLPFIDCVLVAG